MEVEVRVRSLGLEVDMVEVSDVANSSVPISAVQKWSSAATASPTHRRARSTSASRHEVREMSLSAPPPPFITLKALIGPSLLSSPYVE